MHKKYTIRSRRSAVLTFRTYFDWTQVVAIQDMPMLSHFHMNFNAFVVLATKVWTCLCFIFNRQVRAVCMDTFFFSFLSSSSIQSLHMFFVHMISLTFAILHVPMKCYNKSKIINLVCPVSTSEVWSIPVDAGVASSTGHGTTENARIGLGRNTNSFASRCNAQEYCETRNPARFHRESDHRSASSAIFRA